MSLLSVKNVGKAFRAYKSEWHRFANWFGLKIKPAEEHWVLRHINFEIHAGEAIGIIGKNGAGKSTLLKMITGTLQPTEGQVQINGRIAAILELGMGFNPELTGRQNVFHTAGLMGFSSEEIQQATAFRPEILIVDEVLAVGDAAFQRKCFRRIEKYMSEGMTLLLVTHDIESIKKLCTKALFLKDGSQYDYGESKKVCDEYEKYLFGSADKVEQDDNESIVVENTQLELFDPDLLCKGDLNYGNGKAVIEDVWFENQYGNRVNIIKMGDKFTIRYRVLFKERVCSPVFAFLIKTLEGISLYGTDTSSLNAVPRVYALGEYIDILFNLDCYLSAGTYFINCGIRDDSGDSVDFLHRRVDVAMFKVIQNVDMEQAGLVNLSAVFAPIEIVKK
jgi:lipopolysaccharide transport system ATP-binding protein